MKNKKIQFKDLGVKDYKEVWEYQTELFDEIIDVKKQNRKNDTDLQTNNHLLFVNHPHVYTLGKSGDFSNLLLNEEQLKQKDAVFYKINRGGDITYHGPGQLVGYPILDLENNETLVDEQNYTLKGDKLELKQKYITKTRDS